MRLHNALWMTLFLAGATAAQAALYTYNFTGLNTVITDGDPNGIQNSQTLGSISDTVITDVNVTLQLSGGFNGDLYGYLVHDSGFAVLLNRAGTTTSNPFGYPNTGFNVTLDDQAGTDIHVYQTVSYILNGSGQLTGSWQPDGRNIDPDNVVGTDPRTASLSAFNGLNPNGTWTLFLADVSFGGETTLVGWGLEISAVPEPVSVALAIFAGLIVVTKLTRHFVCKRRGSL